MFDLFSIVCFDFVLVRFSIVYFEFVLVQFDTLCFDWFFVQSGIIYLFLVPFDFVKISLVRSFKVG